MSLCPASLVLVAVMNSPRDFEIARLLGWYRIPLRSAPKVIAVDYLAFYQTGAFASEKWCIQYVAPLRGHELTTRRELLRDEPDHAHANHEYYKPQLGPLERLAQPVPAENWRRITFFYTTGEYLLSARSVSDLIVASEERATLWRALRERAGHSVAGQDSAVLYQAQPADLPGVDLDPALLAALLGIDKSPE